VAAGWSEADVILPPAVFDNADLYGEIGQESIWITKYSIVYGRYTFAYTVVAGFDIGYVSDAVNKVLEPRGAVYLFMYHDFVSL